MSGEEKTARHERAAVAYAHQIATNAGLIWREITGQDIGIDAILELPYADIDLHSPRGFALLQVKSRSDAILSGEVKVDYRERHHLYWLTQRLPVLLCLVEPSDADGFSAAGAGCWIDYKSLKEGECFILKTSEQRWTLRVPVESEHVWSSGATKHPDWSSEAKAFRGWIEKVLVRFAEAIVRTFCDAADGYLGSGKPEYANACLKQIPIWEEVLLKPDTRRSVDMLLAKTIRRIGAVEDQLRLGERALRDYGTAEFAVYELALTHWTKACMTRLPEQDLASWEKAIEVLGNPQDWMRWTPGTLRVNLLHLGAYVNIRATLSCLPGKEKEAPDLNLFSELRQVIERWRVCQDNEIVSDPRYHLQLLNALRALCRGYLSRGKIADAESVLRELKEEMKKNPDRETLALTDFFLLTGWAALEGGKPETAGATLECTTYLLRSMRDPLLEWFQDVLRGKWERMKPKG
jgi:Domain of unknown function (DUF4365)